MILGMPTRRIRIAVQSGVFALWVALILATGHPMQSWLATHIPVSLMLRIDPLVMTVVCGAMRIGVTITLLGAVTLAVSLLLGRVFCGWICPLGAIFDVYGWILRRLHVRIEGPSPSWFRFKYYLLAAILVFAVLGGVSPLMGLDPIVLLTRTVATIAAPLMRKSNELVWSVGSPPGSYGKFMDLATLILFMTIMSATTRLSRIWCRTTCPLGAYLAVSSRHSILRRDTQGCVHCGICATHCPTGAINFQNETIYNESECIKCFSCSQECPVDANFFTFKSPLPAVTATQHPVQLNRRAVFTTVAGVAAAAPALRLSAGNPKSQKTLLRPPMSREESDFLTSCIRCSECIKACPSGILKSAGTEFGLRALWTPVMVPTEGPCLQGCNACSQACPTDAILKYPIEKKYAYKGGTAVLESSRCISYTENKYCSECVRACPTNAIEITQGWTPADPSKGADIPAPTGQTPTRPIKVNFDKCIACGACEYECNRIVFGQPAMVTTSYGRATPSRVLEQDPA
jgi:ferredoxin